MPSGASNRNHHFLKSTTVPVAVFLIILSLYLRTSIQPQMQVQPQPMGFAKSKLHSSKTSERDHTRTVSADTVPEQYRSLEELLNFPSNKGFQRREPVKAPRYSSMSSITEPIEPSMFNKSKQETLGSDHKNYSPVPTSYPRHPSKSSRTTNSSKEHVDCKLLFEGNQQELEKAANILKQHPYKFPPDRLFINLTKDCDTFRRSMGYHQKTLSQEEKEYPIAFAIRMHQIVAQAERLLRAIYMPQNVYCIYVDKKAGEEVLKSMSAIASCFDNIFIASHLENFYYAGFSPVQADMQCMKDLLNTSVQWKYFINMPGSEYPLRTNLEMVRILKLLNGTNDIEQYPFPKIFENRIKKVYTIKHSTVTSTNKAKAPFEPPIDLQKGCSYNLFSREFVVWVLQDSLAQRFINWTKDTSDPDETVWGTLNHLPQAPGGYQDMVTQIAKTFLAKEVIWKGGIAYCWGQHFVHSICILSVRDLKRLGRLWHFFANKFHAEYDHIVLDCLEERHRNRTLIPDPEHNVNWDVISRIPQIRATLKRHPNV